MRLELAVSWKLCYSENPYLPSPWGLLISGSSQAMSLFPLPRCLPCATVPFAWRLPACSTRSCSSSSCSCSRTKSPEALLTLLGLMRASSLLPTCVPLLGWRWSLTSPPHCSGSPPGKGRAWRAWCWGTPCPGLDRGPAAPSSVEQTPRPSASVE